MKFGLVIESQYLPVLLEGAKESALTISRGDPLNKIIEENIVKDATVTKFLECLGEKTIIYANLPNNDESMAALVDLLVELEFPEDSYRLFYENENGGITSVGNHPSPFKFFFAMPFGEHWLILKHRKY